MATIPQFRIIYVEVCITCDHPQVDHETTLVNGKKFTICRSCPVDTAQHTYVLKGL